MCRAAGYADADALLGKSYLDFLGVTAADETTTGSAGTAGTRARGSEQLLRRSDGLRVSVEVTMAPVSDSAGRAGRVLFRLRDLSAIRRLEHEHRAIFEATGDGMVVCTMNGLIVAANPAFCEMNGYPCDEVVGRSLTALVDPGAHDLLDEFASATKSRGKLRRRILSLRKDGTSFPADLQGTVIVGEDQPLILGVVRDISEQVRANDLLEGRVAERTRELETVLEVSHNVASELDLEPLLNLILEQLLVVVDYTWAAVLGLEGSRLLRLAGWAHGEPVQTSYGFELGDPQVGSAWEVLHRGECLIADELADQGVLAGTYRRLVVEHPEMAEAAGARSWLLVPLMFQGRTIGAISLLHAEPASYTQHHARLVRAIADQAAVAIENARLYEQAQQAAALEERQHLARELHDAVTQTLFSASIIAEMLPRLWERDPEAGRKRLEDVRSLTRGALAEMRTLLLELRPAAIVEAELGDLLHQLGEVLRGRARLPVATAVEGHGKLPCDVQLAFYRVAQEAFNNINKHARAAKVTVRLSTDARAADLSIRDDGCGFDCRAGDGGGLVHFGLTTMAERAQAVGAQLSLHSAPGQGTEVRIGWQAQQGDRA